MYLPHTSCRACGYTSLTPAFDLGVQPLANNFCLPLEPRAGYAPLKVMFCPQCTLAQLSVVVDPQTLYSHYPYITSRSQTMEHHFAELCKNLIQESGIKNPDLLEIGSNDGEFLRYAGEHGFDNCVGIDPAQNLTNDQTTIHGMFDRHSCEMALKALGGYKPDVIVARHVFCHVDDWREFIRNVHSLCHESTLVVIEVPYVGDLLERTELDSIYHEHTSYLSVNSMSHLLTNSGLMMYQVMRYSIHGGCVCLLIRKGDQKPFDYDIRSNSMDWNAFSSRAYNHIDELRGMVIKLKSDGKKVAGFGASAKATVWINACEFDKDLVEFVTDNTPAKIGRLVPGTEIPVLDESRLEELKPDYLVMFAWNYRDEILKKCTAFRERGGKFIIPVPKLEII